MICSWCSKPISPFKTHDNAKRSVFLSLFYSRDFGPFISTDICQVIKQCLAHSRRSEILVEKEHRLFLLVYIIQNSWVAELESSARSLNFEGRVCCSVPHCLQFPWHSDEGTTRGLCQIGVPQTGIPLQNSIHLCVH